MKANRPQIERALRQAGETRCFVFYGPDESGSAALLSAFKLIAGEGAERVQLAGSELKADPARLADEAASISLFSEKRIIVVEPAGDECLPAFEALIEAPHAGNAVALVCGALKPTSKLLKLALGAPAVLACASYPPDDRDLGRLVTELARGYGLAVRPDVARSIGEAAAGNRAIIARELEKYAAFLDADETRPATLEASVVASLGASSEEGDLSRLVDAVAGGDAAALGAELLRLEGQGIAGISLTRALSRRMALLARLRADVESGVAIASVMATHGRGIFWKEKDAVAAQVSRWKGADIARAEARLLAAERALKASGSHGPVLAAEALFTICRQAGRTR